MAQGGGIGTIWPDLLVGFSHRERWAVSKQKRFALVKGKRGNRLIQLMAHPSKLSFCLGQCSANPPCCTHGSRSHGIFAYTLPRSMWGTHSTLLPVQKIATHTLRSPTIPIPAQPNILALPLTSHCTCAIFCIWTNQRSSSTRKTQTIFLRRLLGYVNGHPQKEVTGGGKMGQERWRS